MVLANICQHRRRQRFAMRDSVNNSRAAEADRRSLRRLALGAILGIGFGWLTAAGWIGTDKLPNTVIARVNDTNIRLVEYQRALRLYASEKREPVTDYDRELLLERMIEEELLLQHGAASALARGDRGVRTTVMRSILAGLMVELEAEAEGVAEKSDNSKTGTAISVGEVADATDTARDNLLRDYLDQLRDAASIEWVNVGPAQ